MEEHNHNLPTLCNTCGEQVGVDANGDAFVACRHCDFPICKSCLDYELSEGRRACLSCNTPYQPGIQTKPNLFLFTFYFTHLPAANWNVMLIMHAQTQSYDLLVDQSSTKNTYIQLSTLPFVQNMPDLY